MKESKKILAVGVVVMMAFLTPSLFAFDGNGRGYRHGGERHGSRGHDGPRGRRHSKGKFFGNVERMKAHLNLSDSQVKKIVAINRKYELAFLNIQEKMEPAEIQLRKLLLNEKINLSKVKSALNKIGKLHTDIRYNRIKQRVEFESILTRVQKDKLRLERRGRGPRGERRGGPRGM